MYGIRYEYRVTLKNADRGLINRILYPRHTRAETNEISYPDFPYANPENELFYRDTRAYTCV